VKQTKSIARAAKRVDLMIRVADVQAEASRTLAVNRAYGVKVDQPVVIRKVG
jgi:hypothetical protein